jgi:1-acyl-sn-glycerol-3-phosphate acyltransferase
MNPAGGGMNFAGPSDDRRALDRAGDTRRPAFLHYARVYSRRKVARGLDGLWVSGLEQARSALGTRPLLFAANHVAWWDPLLLLVLDEALGGTGWAMMDATNLRKLPFMGWVGALPLNRSSHERSSQCLEAAADLLDRPGRALWIFPQGRQRPAHLRPLDLKPGIGILHDRNPIDVVTVSLNYVFLERDRPAAVVRFSAPIAGPDVAGPSLLPAVHDALVDGLAEIDRAAIAATDGRRARTDPRDPLPRFFPLVRPTRNPGQESFGERMLKLLQDRRFRVD